MNTSLFLLSTIRNLILLGFAKKHKIPVVFFIHGWQDSAFNKFKRNELFGGLFKKYINYCDAIFVLSNEFCLKLQDLEISRNKIRLSSTMAICSKFTSSPKHIGERINLLFCSNIKEHKGPFVVLDTVSEITKRNANVHYYFVGSGDDFDNLKNRINREGLDPFVTLTGFVSEKEKIEIFNKSHIFILPTSHGEGFPTVIIEAMASGLGIICTDKGGIKDNLSENINAMFLKSFPPDSVELSLKIKEMIENNNLFSAISESNVNLSREKFDAKKVVTEINKVFTKVRHA